MIFHVFMTNLKMYQVLTNKEVNSCVENAVMAHRYLKMPIYWQLASLAQRSDNKAVLGNSDLTHNQSQIVDIDYSRYSIALEVCVERSA